MSNFNLVVALIFVMLVFFLGLSFSKSAGDTKSFFAAGGAVPWWISGLSLFMSFFSVGTFVVWGSIAYSDGFVAVVIQMTMSVAGFAVGIFIAPRWHKVRALTAAQFIAERFGSATQKFYIILFLLLSLFSAGAFLYPIGKMIEVAFGTPFTLSILVLGITIIIYTAVGGLWAVLVTDVLQFVVLTAAVMIIVPLSFAEVGSINHFVQSVPDDFFSLTNQQFDWTFMAAFTFYNMVFIGGSWAYVQRYTSVASPKHARNVGLLFGSLYCIAPLIWMLPPMMYRALTQNSDGVDAENAYFLISQRVAPLGVMGLMVGAMVFATASSVNTVLNIAAGVFTHDVYTPMKGASTEKHKMVVARIATVVFGLFALTIALSVSHMGGIVEVAFSLAAITGTALFLPPIWAMFSKFQTGRSVVVCTCTSLLINVFFKFFSPSLLSISLGRSAEMLVGVLVPILLLACYEIYTRYTGRVSQQYTEYMKLIHAKTPDKQNHTPTTTDANTYGTKVIAIGVLMIGTILLLLSLFAAQHKTVVIITGILVVIVGTILYPKTAKAK